MSTSTAARSRAARGGAAGAVPGAAGAGLGNRRIGLPPAPGQVDRATASRDRRNGSWQLRRRLWEVSSLERVRKCGRFAHSDVGGPTLRISGPDGARTAGLAGLQSCGSVWSCPVCARKIGARRAEEIRQVMTGVFAAGGGAALITLTMRHQARHLLTDSWDAVQYGWSRVTSGRAYQQDRADYGITGWCAVIECTHGEHGWHPHFHVLVAFDSPWSAEALESLGGRWFDRWQRALTRRGFSALAERGGLDVRVVTGDDASSGALGSYLSKIANEVTGSSSKRGRRGSRTPFQVISDGVSTGLADDIELWWVWEQASHGRRQLTWSQGFRERYGLGVEQTDAEIAAEDVGSDDLIALPPETWEHVRWEAESLLSAGEVGGLPAAIRWLESRGLTWAWTTPAPTRDHVPRRARAPRLPCATEAATRRRR